MIHSERGKYAELEQNLPRILGPKNEKSDEIGLASNIASSECPSRGKYCSTLPTDKL